MSNLVLSAEVYADEGMSASDMRTIQFTLGGDCIYMDQTTVDQSDEVTENGVTIHSADQAVAVIQAIKAFASAIGWKLEEV